MSEMHYRSVYDTEQRLFFSIISVSSISNFILSSLLMTCLKFKTETSVKMILDKGDQHSPGAVLDVFFNVY